MKKSFLVMVLAGVMALTTSAAAANPSPSNTTILNVDTCVPLIGGGDVCIESKGVIHETATPSGNESFVANYRERLRVIEGDQVVWDETSDERVHALTMDGVLKEMSDRSRFTITNVGAPFCVQYHLHGTNGEDQFVRIDFC